MSDKFKFILNQEVDEGIDYVFTATRHEGIDDVFIVSWDDPSVSYESFPYYQEDDILRYIKNGDWILISE